MRDVRREVAASPSGEDFAREAGATVKYAADGSWTATIRDPENIRRAVRMQDGSRAIEVERGMKLDAKRPKERLVDADGRFMDAPVHLAEQIAKRRNLKPKVFWGKASARWVARNGELVKVL